MLLIYLCLIMCKQTEAVNCFILKFGAAIINQLENYLISAKHQR